MLPAIIGKTGKYRFLVISIALFLIFDLGVLGLNFYTSGKIAEQTERINLAGRQRTLTQQMSKATLYIKAQKLQLWVYQSGLDELTNYYTVFDNTLALFDQGGSITSTETGEKVVINKVKDQQAREILDASIVLWRDFKEVMKPLLVDVLITDEEIVPASEFIANNNLKMLVLMNQLTERFTVLSERQTNFLRTVQVIGILLATINFFIILFHFIRQLRERDNKLEIKEHESDQILSTIAEGVFLVDENMVIGGQYSRFLQEIFQLEKISGRKFKNFLNQYFSQKVVKTTIDYVQLYYKKHINPELIADVNPLKRVKALVPNKDNEVVEKYLDFSFALIRQNSGENAVLVTVNDVTDSMRLELESSKKWEESELQMAILSQLINIDANDLSAFVSELDTGYERLNELLKNNKHVSDNYKKTLIRLFREAHKLKGSASVIDLHWVVDILHEFESLIDDVQRQASNTELTGKSLLPLTIKLNSMYEKLDQIKNFSQRFNLHAVKVNEPKPLAANGPIIKKEWLDLKQMASKLAKDRGVSVDVHLRGLSELIDDQLSDKLLKMSVQLVRNSIAHGLESEQTRSRLKKPNAGQIAISLSHDSNNNYRFVYEDDGRGFDYQAIKEALIKKGDLNSQQVAQLSKTDLIKRTFSDSFSSMNDVDVLAGRGVGLPLVLSQIKEFDGKIKIRSVEKEFTRFIIDFNVSVSNHAAAIKLTN